MNNTAIVFDVMDLKSRGFNFIWYSKTKDLPKKIPKVKPIKLTDENPICNRLMEIFKHPEAIKSIEHLSCGGYLIKVIKPTSVLDGFFSDGYYRITI